jgi:hypothetical protein
MDTDILGALCCFAPVNGDFFSRAYFCWFYLKTWNISMYRIWYLTKWVQLKLQALLAQITLRNIFNTAINLHYAECMENIGISFSLMFAWPEAVSCSTLPHPNLNVIKAVRGHRRATNTWGQCYKTSFLHHKQPGQKARVFETSNHCPV